MMQALPGFAFRASIAEQIEHTHTYGIGVPETRVSGDAA